MTAKQHAHKYLALLKDRNGMIPDDIDDDIMQEFVEECETAFAEAQKDFGYSKQFEIVQELVRQLAIVHNLSDRAKHFLTYDTDWNSIVGLLVPGPDFSRCCFYAAQKISAQKIASIIKLERSNLRNE